MRQEPEGVRIAVATLYIRMRDARRRRVATLASQGPESPAYTAADATYTEAWNGLQSVISRVSSERLRYESAHKMVDLLARRARLQAAQPKAA